MSDPICTPPILVRASIRGVAYARGMSRCRPAEPRFVRNIAECAAGVVRDTYVDFIARNIA
jgi:hypothetical protein